MEIPRCSQTWIAPEVIGALGVSDDDRVLSVAAGGDVALGLAGAREVVHVAADAADAALFELKRMVAAELPVEGARCLLGVDAPGRRVFLYHLVRGAMPEPARAFWDARESLVRAGILRAGRVEAALERARKGLRSALLGPGGRVPAPALAPIVRVALAGVGLERPDGLSLGAALARLRARQRGALATWVLDGTWDRPDEGHSWLTPTGHARLRGALDRLSLVERPVESWLPEQTPGRFNVLIAGPAVSPEALRALLSHARSGATLLRPRWVGEPVLDVSGWRRDLDQEQRAEPFALAYERYEIVRRS